MFQPGSLSSFLRVWLRSCTSVDKSGLNTLFELYSHYFVPIFAYRWGISATLILVALPTLTYLITSIQAKNVLRREARTREQKPPVLPYWIPFLGHQFSFLWNTAGLNTWIEYVLHWKHLV